MWDLLGWIIVAVFILFGVTVMGWLFNDRWFTPNFLERHKTKTLITPKKEQ